MYVAHRNNNNNDSSVEKQEEKHHVAISFTAPEITKKPLPPIAKEPKPKMSFPQPKLAPVMQPTPTPTPTPIATPQPAKVSLPQYSETKPVQPSNTNVSKASNVELAPRMMVITPVSTPSVATPIIQTNTVSFLPQNTILIPTSPLPAPPNSPYSTSASPTTGTIRPKITAHRSANFSL